MHPADIGAKKIQRLGVLIQRVPQFVERLKNVIPSRLLAV